MVDCYLINWCHDMTRYDNVTSPPPHTQIHKTAIRGKYKFSCSCHSCENVLRFDLSLPVMICSKTSLFQLGPQLELTMDHILWRMTRLTHLSTDHDQHDPWPWPMTYELWLLPISSVHLFHQQPTRTTVKKSHDLDLIGYGLWVIGSHVLTHDSLTQS